MKKTLKLILLCLASSLLSGCTTTIRLSPSSSVITTKPQEEGITLILDPLEGQIEGSQEIVEVEYKKGETVSLPLPKKARYSFDGWFIGEKRITSSDGKILEGIDFKTNLTLTAKYIMVKTIRLDVLYESALIKSFDSFPLKGDIYSSLTGAIELDDPFWGWYKDSSMNQTVTLANDLDIDINNSAKVYAKKAQGFNILEKVTDNSDETKKTEIVLESIDKDILPEEINLNNLFFKGKRITTIGEKAFLNNEKLKDIVLNDDLKEIGPNAFDGCQGLTKILIPKSVSTIGDYAFKDCPSLKIYCEAKSKPSGWYSFWNADKGQVNQPVIERQTTWDSIGETGTYQGLDYTKNPVGGITITKYNNVANEPEVEIPETIDGLTVTGIGANSFQKLAVTSLRIPNSVTYIGNSAFSGCSLLEKINIPTSATFIGNTAFYFCRLLTSINIPTGVKSIGYGAFQNCNSLSSLTLPEGLKTIDLWAFQSCSALVNVTIPKSVTYLGKGIFQYCRKLERIELPEGITSVTRNMFDQCDSLREVIIPDSVTLIDEYAFAQCYKLASIKIPEGIEKISFAAFDRCQSLTEIQIPSSVKEIEGYAFSGCSSLTEVKIPSGVTKIASYAFQDCTSLTSITIPSSVETIQWDVFKNCPKLNIKAEAASKPEGWDKDCNSNNRPVEWGYKES